MLHSFVCLFVCLFVYKITQFVQLAGIQLAIQHYSKYISGLLIIWLDFVLTDGATIQSNGATFPQFQKFLISLVKTNLQNFSKCN